MPDEPVCPNCGSEVPDGGVVMLGGLGMWLTVPGALLIIILGAGLAVTSRIGPTIWA
jgi:hypothetical protein